MSRKGLFVERAIRQRMCNNYYSGECDNKGIILPGEVCLTSISRNNTTNWCLNCLLKKLKEVSK